MRMRDDGEELKAGVAMKNAKRQKGEKGRVGGGVSPEGGHGRKMLLAALLVMGVIGGVYVVQAAVAYGRAGGTQGQAVQGGAQANNDDGDSVSVPISDLSAQAKKYTTVLGGKAVSYLAVVGTDGMPRTAFDGCEVCGGSMGFRQEGGDLVCNKCGKRFRIDDLGSKNLLGGGCMPVNLPYTVADGKLVIKKADLSAGARLF